MDREIIRRVILEYQDVISQIQLVERPFIFEQLGNYVFVGVRQAGKSYLLYQQAQQLLCMGHVMEEIVYVNFDDERISDISKDELDLILQAHRTLSDHQPILFLDEIQNVEGWEHFARRLANQKYQVYVTGSNAKMLSRDIATVLGGRFWLQNVFTYSFQEYLKACQVQLRKNWQSTRQQEEVAKAFNTYFYFGGFPELVNVVDKRSWLNGIFKKILFSDVIVRNGIRNEEALRMTVRRMAECVKQPTSYNRICNLVKSTGVSTNVQSIIDFAKYLRESCLIFSIENYASKFVEKETVKKHYFIDNGLLNIFLTDPDSSLLENMCAIHLYKKYEDELYFYNKDIEVDFYIPNERMAVQSCFRLGEDETTRREVQALEKLDKLFDLQRLVIVSRDTEDTISLKNGKTVQVVPVWKWLLE
ncbi:MAG: ATP-binding protein [Bacteroidaceae bacterium]|nr:ATP-binding protein [Bacteroidaceae bacterium]